MNPQAAQSRRLLLALDASRCCPDDVVLAVELAAMLGGDLEGLFVEDDDLMTLARLPFAREVGGRSGQNRAMPGETVESVVKRRVERAAGELERAARLRNVPVRHTTTRGKVVRQAFAQGERRDILILQPAARSVPTPRRAVGRPILAWYEGDGEAATALDLAVALARTTGSELLVGVPAGRFGTESDVRGLLARWIARLPGRVRVQVVYGTPTDAIVGTVRTARAAQVILAANSDLASVDGVERLLAVIGVGLVLVR